MDRPAVSVREGCGLAACIAAGLVLRMLALSAETAWCDEALTAACLPASSLSEYVRLAFERDPTIRLAPLYHGIQFVWASLFGGELYSLRMLSVTLSAVAMVQVYFLARKLVSPATARWAVLLFGLSLFQIYYAQEVRVYALLNVLALASINSLWSFATGARRALWWALGFNAALLLTHSFTVVFVLAEGAAVLLLARPPREALRWIGMHAVLAAGFCAWIFLIGYDLGEEGAAFVGAPAGLRELAALALQFSGARFSNRNPGDYLAGGWNAELAVLALVALLALLPVLRVLRGSRAHDDHRREVLFLLVWMMAPVLLLFIIGRLWHPCFYPRYVIYCAIPLVLLAAMGLTRIGPALARRAVGGVLIALLLWQGLALPRPFRADYGAVARAVDSDPAVEKSVLALKRFNYLAVDYALRDQGVKVDLLYGLKEITGIAMQRAAEGKSVWAIFYLWTEYEAFETALTNAGLAFRSFESAGMPPLTIYHIERVAP